MMKSPEDWDYADLRQKLLRRTAPPYMGGSSSPGNHCHHCPKPSDETCSLSCSVEYANRYGFTPELS
jgi:hypothetical protein